MKNKYELLFPIIYTLIMAIGMTVAYNIFGYSYTTPNIVRVLLYFEAIMSVYTLIVYIKYYPKTSFNKFTPYSLFIIYASFILLFLILFIIHKSYFSNPSLFFITILTNLFVGFSEELMYRGIVLQGFLKNNSKKKACFYSSIVFSLLHIVNIFAAFPLHSVFIQLINTFVFGLLVSSFAVKIGTILPLIIIHTLWDTFVSDSSFVDKYSPLIALFVIFETVVAFIAFYSLPQENIIKKQNKNIN